jgi:hypothetical protein
MHTTTRTSVAYPVSDQPGVSYVLQVPRYRGLAWHSYGKQRKKVIRARAMSGGTFHYEQRRLENDLVALEPFDVRVFSPLKAMSKISPRMAKPNSARPGGSRSFTWRTLSKWSKPTRRGLNIYLGSS